MKVGIINKTNNPTFIESNFSDFIIFPEDDTITIQKSDIVFFFDDIEILPNNTFNTKNLNHTIESWGYCFENEINVSGKIFVISSNLNPKEFQRINEILNPMNVEVVYLPPTSEVHNGKVILGTLNPIVISKLQSLFIHLGFKNLSVTSMSPSSAEIINLLDNNLRYLKHTYSKMIEEVVDNTDEMGLINSFLRLDVTNETLDMKLKNDVLQSYIGKISTPINFAHDINYNLENHNIYILNNILDNNLDSSVPLVIDGLTYTHSDMIVDNKKIFVILELIKRGYTIHIYESEKFLRDKKIIGELLHDFQSQVKFYKKGTEVIGQLIEL